MQITNLQKQTVEKILRYFESGAHLVAFKAPTGSGKTLMASHFIAEVILREAKLKHIFVIATISSSDLPRAFETKIEQYKCDLPTSNFEVEYYESPSAKNPNKNATDATSEIRLIENKVYIFGKASFGKDRIYTEQGTIEDFLREAKQQGYKIIYIRDEAHIGSEKTSSDSGVKNFESLMQDAATFTLKMTATFDKKNTDAKRVELRETDLINENKNDGFYLLKTHCKVLSDEAITDDELLQKAISEFKLIKENYKKLERDYGIVIRPALLLQVDNEPSDKEKKVLFLQSLEKIQDALTSAGFSWVQYFGANDTKASNVDNSNFTLAKITRNDDPTDVIIFKIGPATGWDIPRACMLLQLRSVSSSSLKIQTVGRIKRNPFPGLQKNDITDCYYLYSNEPKVSEKDFSIYEHSVKEELQNELFAVVKIENKNLEKTAKEKIAAETKEFLNKNKNAIMQRLDECFIIDKNVGDEKIFHITETHQLFLSCLQLLKFLKLKLMHLNAPQKEVVNAIRTYYKNSDWKNDKVNVKCETLLLIVLQFFMAEVNAIVKKSLEQNVKYKITSECVKPATYTSAEENASEVCEPRVPYLFDIKKDGVMVNDEMLDSKNEITVAKEIIKFITNTKTYTKKDAIKVWAKNQRSGSIYGEYLDSENNFRKSYFDFIMKFQNDAILYIEVKGKKDIDKNKTNELKTNYEKYFAGNVANELFTKHLIVCVAYVDGETITTDVFAKENIKQKLETLSFENMLVTINELE